MELTAEDGKDIGTGVTHRFDLQRVEEGYGTGARLSLEAVIRVRHQLDYFLSAEHLENNAHARSLYKSNGMKFYVSDVMSWPSMAGLTVREVISVVESLTGDDVECSEIGLWIPADSYEVSVSSDEEGSSDEELTGVRWWPQLSSGEKASANLREVFVVSVDCNSVFMDKRSQLLLRAAKDAIGS